MNITQLQAIMPHATSVRCSTFLAPLNNTMEEFSINTLVRQAAFLAQLAHESGELRYVRELADGKAYEGRADLGNNVPGDGVKYKGRGLIQITGKANYVALALALDIDCVVNPEVLEEPVNAARSAGWFWQTRSLNPIADVGDFEKLTRKINGGVNGLPDRQYHWELAKKALGL